MDEKGTHFFNKNIKRVGNNFLKWKWKDNIGVSVGGSNGHEIVQKAIRSGWQPISSFRESVVGGVCSTSHIIYLFAYFSYTLSTMDHFDELVFLIIHL